MKLRVVLIEVNPLLAYFNLLGTTLLAHLINLLVIIIILFLLFKLIRKIYLETNFWQRDLKFIEIILPGFYDTNTATYRALFESFHGLASSSLIALEVVNLKGQGIRFLIGCSKADYQTVKSIIKTAIPGVALQPAEDYLSKLKSFKLVSYKLKIPFYNSLSEEKSASYLGAMVDLNNQATMAFQTVIQPLDYSFNKQWQHKINQGQIKNHRWLIKLSLLPKNIIYKLFFARSNFYSMKSKSKNKLENPLFKTSLRLLISSDNQGLLKSKVNEFSSLLASNNFKGQLLTKTTVTFNSYELFKRRVIAPFKTNNILSSSELASLYNMPLKSSYLNAGLNKNLSHQLIGLNSKPTKHDLILGKSDDQSKKTFIALSTLERQRHIYIVGATGSGKSTMLKYALYQDMKNNNGLLLIDPHGDLAEDILRLVPTKRLKDLIYFNPADPHNQQTINLLEIPKDLSSVELARHKDMVVESVISIFRKTFETNNTKAYRIERILSNVIYTALSIEGATLFTLRSLLTDKNFRDKVVNNLADAKLRNFWQEEFNKAGEYQRVKLLQGPLSRIDRFERTQALNNVLSNNKSTLDFQQIINSNKILICNLSKGALGEDASSVLGGIILAKMQLSGLSRQNITIKKRTPFYMYIDEFQNYASEAFMSLFSEARKYGLAITMAQQSLAQIKDKNLLATILDNTGTVVVFRQQSLSSQKLLLNFFQPYIDIYELSNLELGHFYISIRAVKLRQPISGQTILLK